MIAVVQKKLDGFTLIESNPRSVRNLAISGYFAGLGAWERPGCPGMAKKTRMARSHPLAVRETQAQNDA
jgi:hypothetical protein